jgi:hypothetical protein
MKFTNKTSETIIFVNELNFAELINVDISSFTYKIFFEIDLNEAAKKNNSFSGKVFVSKTKKTTIEPIFNFDLSLNTKKESIAKDNKLGNLKIIENIQQLSLKRKENTVRNDQNIILTKNFSMYDFASTEAIEKSKRNNFSIEEKQKTLAEISKIDKLKEFIPNYKLSEDSSSQTITSKMQTALSKGIDPAALAFRTKGIKNIDKTTGGISVPYKPLNEVQNAIISQRQEIPQISNNTLATTIKNITKTTVKVSLDIVIQKNLVDSLNELYFEIEMYDDAARPTANKQITVNHKKALDIFLTPKFAPKIVSYYRRGSDGKLVLFLRQNDENATSISLYYKEIDKKITENKYFYLGSYEIRKSEGEKKIEINKTLNKKIILRAISNYQNSKNCLLFDSVVIEENKNVNIENVAKQLYNSILNYQLNEDNSITINGTVNETEVSSILLYKRLLNTNEEILLFGPYKLDQNKNFSYKDSDTKPNTIYEYFIKLIKKDGTIVNTNFQAIVHNKDKVSNILSTNIVNPLNSINSNELNVEFELKTNLERKNITLVIENFKNLGIYDLYKDLFESSDISTSFAYRVTRTNIQTGVEEDFGILTDNKFNDKFLRTSKNIKPLEAGYQYRYKIYTYFRTPVTLLPKLILNETYRNKTYQYYPYFSRHPFTLKNGTLLTENTLKEQHVENDYSFGPSSEIIEYIADFSKNLPIIKEVKATNLNKTLNILNWAIDGNLEKIDHFIVSLVHLGIKSIVGSTHNISDSNSFNFYDILTEGESGEVYYTIIPVYFDYSLGQEISSNTIII